MHSVQAIIGAMVHGAGRPHWLATSMRMGQAMACGVVPVLFIGCWSRLATEMQRGRN
jgi:hypothetical protein